MSKHPNTIKITNCLPVLRAQKNITQQELANAIGVTRATVIAIEKGNYNPSLELAFQLAGFFKTDINNIFSVKEA